MIKKHKTCGECTVCCSALLIDTPNFKKPADIKCIHVKDKGGCSIYEKRPEVCRSWECGWLALSKLRNSLRPDKSNLLIRLEEGGSITLQPIGNAIRYLTNTDALEVIATWINYDAQVAISVPTKTGHAYANHVLNQTINKHDIATEALLKTKVIAAIISASSAQTDLIDIKFLEQNSTVE
ncbi:MULTISPECIES: YkgJ family cysteine cluster protein [Pseudomonas syringae group]|uniref:YkgJ family cysteine cluster protein n=1 Tax=Pseudomonas syringae group TaxID=136849 RepID=UPI0006ABC9BF|nr:hypothetical protein [Pseudomonas coronafaciens]